MKFYNKLVRDKIPAIIEAQGLKCKTEIISGDRYRIALDGKLWEELEEYYRSHDVEELADLLEVIYAAAKVQGVSAEELDKIREQKARLRGRFDERIMLIYSQTRG